MLNPEGGESTATVMQRLSQAYKLDLDLAERVTILVFASIRDATDVSLQDPVSRADLCDIRKWMDRPGNQEWLA